MHYFVQTKIQLDYNDDRGMDGFGWLKWFYLINTSLGIPFKKFHMRNIPVQKYIGKPTIGGIAFINRIILRWNSLRMGGRASLTLCSRSRIYILVSLVFS